MDKATPFLPFPLQTPALRLQATANTGCPEPDLERGNFVGTLVLALSYDPVPHRLGRLLRTPRPVTRSSCPHGSPNTYWWVAAGEVSRRRLPACLLARQQCLEGFVSLTVQLREGRGQQPLPALLCGHCSLPWESAQQRG